MRKRAIMDTEVGEAQKWSLDINGGSFRGKKKKKAQNRRDSHGLYMLGGEESFRLYDFDEKSLCDTEHGGVSCRTGP